MPRCQSLVAGAGHADFLADECDARHRTLPMRGDLLCSKQFWHIISWLDYAPQLETGGRILEKHYLRLHVVALSTNKSIYLSSPILRHKLPISYYSNLQQDLQVQCHCIFEAFCSVALFPDFGKFLDFNSALRWATVNWLTITSRVVSFSTLVWSCCRYQRRISSFRS